MLEPFGSDIWIAGGPEIVAAAGFRYPTRMAVMRLDGGKLVVWSPVALTDELRSAIDGVGQVHHLVAPNTLHDSFLGDWVTAYPDALVLGPRKLAARRTDIDFAVYLDEEVPEEWSSHIEAVTLAGNRITTEIVLLHSPSRTAIFADLIQHFPRGSFGGWREIVARLDLMVAHEPSVPRKFRLAFTDRQAAQAEVLQILDWPCDKVLFAHGEPVLGDGQSFLRRAFAWLIR